MKKFNITGMSCAACSSRVERAVCELEGVVSCSVNLLTNSMTVDGGDDDEIIVAINKAGYGASLAEGKDGRLQELKKKRSANRLMRRLIASVCFLLPLMYLSMGYTMWGFPLPTVLSANPVYVGLIQMLLCACITVINRQFFLNGVRGIFLRAANMDTLVALGSGVSFLWSVYVLFNMVISISQGIDVHHFLHELYFESAAMILTLITLGKLLEEYAKGRTTDAISALERLAPDTVTVLRDGNEVTVRTKELLVGDEFIVRSGERIAADGVVLKGNGAVNESQLTGESIPTEKSAESLVYAGTVNTEGYLHCRVTSVGDDTAIQKIIKMVSDAAATKAPIAKVADRVAAFFVPAVILIALITSVIWLFVNNSLAYALARGISVLVISCPCALGLATPVAIMVGSGIGAKGGVLFKNATVLEAAGKAKTVVLDKTGTVTKGEPEVTDVYALSVCKEELLSVAYSLERLSSHPLARAICEYSEKKGVKELCVSDFKTFAGRGVYGAVDGKECYGASRNFAGTVAILSKEAEKIYSSLASLGQTPIFFIREGEVIGIISVADTVREDSADAVAELRRMGIYTVLLSGDVKQTADAVGAACGFDEVISEALPADKEEAVRNLCSRGVTVMVGDGINDAPALTAADVGMAVGCGTDVAIDAADVLLLHSSISDVAAAIRLGRATLKTIKENLFWAFIYNIVGIPLAAGAFIHFFGWELSPMFGALAMSLSSFCVVMNALRLNLKKIFVRSDNASLCEKEENMKITLYVKGMMCPHCEARVREAISNIQGVISAQVSHKDGTAKVVLGENIDRKILRAAIEDAGYNVEKTE